jgi:hypothetical protein
MNSAAKAELLLRQYWTCWQTNHSLDHSEGEPAAIASLPKSLNKPTPAASNKTRPKGTDAEKMLRNFKCKYWEANNVSPVKSGPTKELTPASVTWTNARYEASLKAQKFREEATLRRMTAPARRDASRAKGHACSRLHLPSSADCRNKHGHSHRANSPLPKIGANAVLYAPPVPGSPIQVCVHVSSSPDLATKEHASTHAGLPNPLMPTPARPRMLPGVSPIKTRLQVCTV